MRRRAWLGLLRARGERGELEPCRPAVSCTDDHPELVPRHGRHESDQQLLGLLVGEPELGEGDLSELSTSAESVDGQLGCATREQYDVKPARHRPQEERQRGHDGLVVVDQVDVVQHEQRRCRMLVAPLECLHEGRHSLQERARALGRERTDAETRDQLRKRGSHRGPELHAVPVGLVEGQPRRRLGGR